MLMLLIVEIFYRTLNHGRRESDAEAGGNIGEVIWQHKRQKKEDHEIGINPEARKRGKR